MHRDTLVEWKGCFALKSEYSDFNKPEIISNTWVTATRIITEEDRKILGSPASYSNGILFVRFKECVNGNWTREFRLENQFAVESSVRPHPRPKVRRGIPVEYKQGNWYRYLEGKRGWVICD